MYWRADRLPAAFRQRVPPKSDLRAARDIVAVTPCMAVQAPAPERQHDRVLTTDEILALWHGLEGAKMMAEGTKLALKLQLVTAQRKAEIVMAAWDEIDFTDKWWTTPPGKAKNKMAHRVPLSPLALELLQAAKNIAGDSPWLFPSPRTDRHITPEAIDHALRRSGLEALGFSPSFLTISGAQRPRI
jgi:integrase